MFDERTEVFDFFLNQAIEEFALQFDEAYAYAEKKVLEAGWL